MRKPFPAASLSVTSLIAFFASAPLTAQPSSPNLRCMEGVFVLEEFKREGEVFRPPQASGHSVVLNGTVVWIFNDRTQASKQTHAAGVGHYTISETAYSYQYDDFEVFTQTDTGTPSRESSLGRACGHTLQFREPRGFISKTPNLEPTSSVLQMV